MMTIIYGFCIFVFLFVLIGAFSKSKNKSVTTKKRQEKQQDEETLSKIQHINKKILKENVPNEECFIVIDTETSSLEVDEGEVLQLSAIKIQRSTNEVVSYFDSYLKPTENARIDETALKVNGITQYIMDNAPNRKFVFEQFNEYCEGITEVLGYNIQFDMNMLADDIQKEGLEFYLANNEVLKTDVLKLVRDCNFETTNNKLVTITEYLNIEHNNAHNSLSDCLATANVYLRVKDKNIFKNKTTDFFTDKNVYISGYFDEFSRAELFSYILTNKGKIVDKISSKTNIVIVGKNSYYSLEEKCQNLIDKGHKINLLNEQDILILSKGYNV